jgi:hypothetical protein
VVRKREAVTLGSWEFLRKKKRSPPGRDMSAVAGKKNAAVLEQ